MFPINPERLDASVFTSMLPATKRRSRTCATRATDIISERKHCSRRRGHTHRSNFRRRVNAQTIARKRWHGARKRKCWNVRSTCGRLYAPAACKVVDSLHHSNAEYRGTSRELGYNGSAQHRPQFSFQNEF